MGLKRVATAGEVRLHGLHQGTKHTNATLVASFEAT
jgi:hypothetical protein